MFKDFIEKNKDGTRAVSLGVFLALVIIVVFLFYTKDDSNNGAVGENEIATTSTEGLKYTIEPVSQIQSTIPVPDLNRAIIFSDSNLSGELKESYKTSIEKLIAELKKEPKDINKWIELGAWRKNIGDYEGARDAWVYVTLISPRGVVSFSNLGDLYHYYLKDFAKAETYLKRAISLEPNNIMGYSALHDLYSLSYKEKSAEAPNILKEGLKYNPGNYNLLVLLAGYYKETGNKTEATLYYKEAILSAEKLGRADLVEAIQAEISALGAS